MTHQSFPKRVNIPEQHVKHIAAQPPMVGIVGYSGSGKTTTMVSLIEILTRNGLRIGTIKHDAHGFEMDQPGKDSWRHKKAGALTAVITSPFQIGMVRDVDHDHGPENLLPLLVDMDIVLVEGFKRRPYPKIEVYRPETGKLPACKGDRHLLALVSDSPLDWGVPRFALSDMNGLANYIVKRFNLKRKSKVICEVAVC